MTNEAEQVEAATPEATTKGEWWGTFEVPEGRGAAAVVGPLTVTVRRFEDEWRVGVVRTNDALAEDARSWAAVDEMPCDGSDECIRVACRGEDRRVIIRPRLVDRPVVSKPASPFTVPPDENVRVFIGSPIHVEVVSVSPERVLWSGPAYPPSDTWFGPPNQDGELCYASRTVCTLREDELVLRPHRAVTSVLVRNRGDDTLHLDRVKLPVQRSRLFCGSNGWLWTQDIVLDRKADAEFANIEVRSGKPSSMPNAKMLAGPAVEGSGNVMIRAFGAWFAQNQ